MARLLPLAVADALSCRGHLPTGATWEQVRGDLSLGMGSTTQSTQLEVLLHGHEPGLTPLGTMFYIVLHRFTSFYIVLHRFTTFHAATLRRDHAGCGVAGLLADARALEVDSCPRNGAK